ncbi:hypothetical protein GN958_ATG06158, partial [Phytophthora infestans]
RYLRQRSGISPTHFSTIFAISCLCRQLVSNLQKHTSFLPSRMMNTRIGSSKLTEQQALSTFVNYANPRFRKGLEARVDHETEDATSELGGAVMLLIRLAKTDGRMSTKRGIMMRMRFCNESGHTTNYHDRHVPLNGRTQMWELCKNTRMNE